MNNINNIIKVRHYFSDELLLILSNGRILNSNRHVIAGSESGVILTNQATAGDAVSFFVLANMLEHDFSAHIICRNQALFNSFTKPIGDCVFAYAKLFGETRQRHPIDVVIGVCCACYIPLMLDHLPSGFSALFLNHC